MSTCYEETYSTLKCNRPQLKNTANFLEKLISEILLFPFLPHSFFLYQSCTAVSMHIESMLRLIVVVGVAAVVSLYQKCAFTLRVAVSESWVYCCFRAERRHSSTAECGRSRRDQQREHAHKRAPAGIWEACTCMCLPGVFPFPVQYTVLALVLVVVYAVWYWQVVGWLPYPRVCFRLWQQYTQYTV